MADSNRIALAWKQPANNVIARDGFYAEYAAKDWAELNKTAEGTGATAVSGSAANLFYDKNSEKIILKPNIDPIDMVGTVQADGALLGDWWTPYGDYATFAMANASGNPKRQMIYQNVVQYPSGSSHLAATWLVRAGLTYGQAKIETWKENQGFVLWFDGNMLPENEENQLAIHLYHLDPRKTTEVVNGIYVKLTSGKELAICHYIDSSDSGKIPPSRVVNTQWASGSISAQKKFVEWTGDPAFYILLIVDKYILFGVNGLDNPFVFECQNYEQGTTPEGLKYPIVLRAGATFEISGKGQAKFGFKKIAYNNEATIVLPEFVPGYNVENSIQGARAVRVTTKDDLVAKWKKGNASSGYKIAGEITLKGNPMPVTLHETGEIADRDREYRAANSETTPVFSKMKIWDDQSREGSDVDLPADVTGRILVCTETANLGENRVISDHTVDVECYGDFGEMFSGILGKKQLRGEPSITLRDSATPISLGYFIFKQPEVMVKEYGDISLKIKGEAQVLQDLKTAIGYVISYDDRRKKDVDAMRNICDIVGVDFATDVTGVYLPETVEGKEGAWTFQPNATFLEILAKLAGVQEQLLTCTGSGVEYKIVKSTTDFTIGRGPEYGTENINPKQSFLYRSRIYVIGRAGETTSEHKRGEKLIGIWRSKALEKEIGYSPHTEVNESLTDWTMVQRRGDLLWSRFNLRPYSLPVDLPDARSLYEKIKIGNVFLWKDSEYPQLHDKRFLITAFSKTTGMTDCQAHVQGEILP